MGQINNPTQIVLITSRYKDKDNVMAMTWWTKTSFQPNLYIISVAKIRYSYELIRKSKCFVINFMPYEFKDKILICGKKSGKDFDKFKECGFHKIEAEKINCPIIKEAIAYLECKIVKKIDSGDHTLFLGEVVNSKLIRQAKRAFQLDKDVFTTTID